ncbi:hypothetical protein VNO80_11466 [Phaseolus coccineus]|uniref:Uncharacterized protein n=1 Tax=Phaseolus coccineus TaxID=3886 RepID=A0AAN9NFE7_PHACN
MAKRESLIRAKVAETALSALGEFTMRAKISKNKRHLDRAAALDVWERLEEFVRARFDFCAIFRFHELPDVEIEFCRILDLYSFVCLSCHAFKLGVGQAVGFLFLLSFIKLFFKGKQYCCLSFCASENSVWVKQSGFCFFFLLSSFFAKENNIVACHFVARKTRCGSSSQVSVSSFFYQAFLQRKTILLSLILCLVKFSVGLESGLTYRSPYLFESRSGLENGGEDSALVLRIQEQPLLLGHGKHLEVLGQDGGKRMGLNVERVRKTDITTVCLEMLGSFLGLDRDQIHSATKWYVGNFVCLMVFKPSDLFRANRCTLENKVHLLFICCIFYGLVVDRAVSFFAKENNIVASQFVSRKIRCGSSSRVSVSSFFYQAFLQRKTILLPLILCLGKLGVGRVSVSSFFYQAFLQRKTILLALILCLGNFFAKENNIVASHFVSRKTRCGLSSRVSVSSFLYQAFLQRKKCCWPSFCASESGLSYSKQSIFGILSEIWFERFKCSSQCLHVVFPDLLDSNVYQDVHWRIKLDVMLYFLWRAAIIRPSSVQAVASTEVVSFDFGLIPPLHCKWPLVLSMEVMQLCSALGSVIEAC